MSSQPFSLRIRAAVCTLTLALVMPVLIQGRDTSAAIAELSGIDIYNFGRINPNYYRGGAPDDDDYAALASLGIKTLIDLRSDDGNPQEKVLAEKAGMSYVTIPMTTHEAPSSVQVAEFLRTVNDPAHQPVYVHCVEGRHRTGVMTAVYRMTQDHWTADQAFKEMKAFKFGADFLHPQFKRFVYDYKAPVVLADNVAETAIR